MNWFSIIVVVLISGLLVWLVVDTTIWIVKKIKQKKKDKEVKQDSTNE